jgi:hypothetical protein
MSPPRQISADNIESNRGPPVPHMWLTLDRWPTQIDTHFSLIARFKRLEFSP